MNKQQTVWNQLVGGIFESIGILGWVAMGFVVIASVLLYVAGGSN